MSLLEPALSDPLPALAGEQSNREPENPSQSGKRGPPQYDPSQHRAGTESIAQVPARDFKQSVGDRERAGDQTPILRAEVEFILHPGVLQRICRRGRHT